MRLVESPERPLIGISTKAVQDGLRPWDKTKIYGQTYNYAAAINQAGGSAVMIPQLEDKQYASMAALDATFDKMQGLVLAGGNDIDPGLYGEIPHPATERISSLHDQTEIRLIELAKESSKPLLAICRGAQMLNVVEGGSLYQHLPDDVGETVDHINAGKELPDRLHPISFDLASDLGRIMLPKLVDGMMDGDSHHHQGLRELGQGLRPVAWTADGVVEGIESENPAWFAIGVQWHAESPDETYHNLFAAFVDAARSQPAKRAEAA